LLILPCSEASLHIPSSKQCRDLAMSFVVHDTHYSQCVVRQIGRCLEGGVMKGKVEGITGKERRECSHDAAAGPLSSHVIVFLEK
jgi:hypothetical protein